MLQSHGFASALMVTGWFGVATHIFAPSLKQQPRKVPIVKQGLTLILFQEFVNPCQAVGTLEKLDLENYT